MNLPSNGDFGGWAASIIIATLLGGVFGALVEQCRTAGIRQQCEPGKSLAWVCRDVPGTDSDGHATSVENCVCQDGGAP